MSYSTLCAIYKTVATGLREYRNGWGTGPAVWDYLSTKYLGTSWGLRGDDRLWKLARDASVPLPVRACHAFTFDGAVIPRDKLSEMADLLQEGAAILEAASPDRVNHFRAIADDLRKLKLHPRAVGVGLNCTSVSDVWPREAKHWAHKPWDCYAYVTGASA
jgi:hypothetical protein